MLAPSTTLRSPRHDAGQSHLLRWNNEIVVQKSSLIMNGEIAVLGLGLVFERRTRRVCGHTPPDARAPAFVGGSGVCYVCGSMEGKGRGRIRECTAKSL